MTCTHCDAAASSWTHGGFVDGCLGCFVRALARLPQHHRREAYASHYAKHQDMAAVRALQAEVKTEHERIQALHAAAMGTKT